VNLGFAAEQVKDLTEAAARGAAGPLTATIIELSRRLGATEDATKALLRIVGEQDAPPERLSETLNRGANDYIRLRDQAAALKLENESARGRAEQAQAAIAGGAFPEARRLLRAAVREELAAAQAARTLREQAQAAEDARMLGA